MKLRFIMYSNIMWKSVNLNFGQLSLNLTHCAAPQAGIEPRVPWTRFDITAVRFDRSSLVHNCYNRKLAAELNQHPDTQQHWTQLASN